MSARARTRLDAALVERGLAETRSRAQALVMSGRVRVDGAVVDKAGAQVTAAAVIEVEEPPRFVSRGGDKLETGMRRWGVDVRGERCLDVGASTGGFTDCLLQHGAAGVIALDVGRAQLHERLRAHPSVVVLERVNARDLEPGMLPWRPQFITADVSFISLRLVLPPAIACAAASCAIRRCASRCCRIFARSSPPTAPPSWACAILRIRGLRGIASTSCISPRPAIRCFRSAR
jgi:23S rRNA (cytidine1920-2'-O)/16S rRNA (cytidine1409-2'-O)-methyltransferase